MILQSWNVKYFQKSCPSFRGLRGIALEVYIIGWYTPKYSIIEYFGIHIRRQFLEIHGARLIRLKPIKTE